MPKILKSNNIFKKSTTENDSEKKIAKLRNEINNGRFNRLTEHGSYGKAHTETEHINQTTTDMLNRLLTGNNDKMMESVFSFDDKETADLMISETVFRHAGKIIEWQQSDRKNKLDISAEWFPEPEDDIPPVGHGYSIKNQTVKRHITVGSNGTLFFLKIVIPIVQDQGCGTLHAGTPHALVTFFKSMYS